MEHNNEWVEDCMHFHGKVLTGEYAHWCPDWDYLPIDETCEPEFGCCLCGYRRIIDNDCNTK